MEQTNKSHNRPALWLTEAEQAAMKDFWVVYDAKFDEISAVVLETVTKRPQLKAMSAEVPPEKMREQRSASRLRMQRAIFDGEWDMYMEYLQREGMAYAQRNVDYAEWSELLSAFRCEAIRQLVAAYSSDPDHLADVLSAQSKFSDLATAVIGQAYLDSKENIIIRQQEVIQELSTPVLQLRDQLLLMPIIGLIDSFRAQQITEHLLQAIRTHRARVVVLDITGVLTVDSMVANHVIKTVEAARLMGAQTIVTGILTEIAQTLVRIGVDLSELNTLGNLNTGITEANRILGYKVVRLVDNTNTIELSQGQPS